MNKEEILKLIYELPKEKTNNPISAFNSVNMEDIEKIINSMNENKTYIDLVKENKQLKDNWNKLKDWCKNFSTDEFNYNFLVVRIIDILIKMQELEKGEQNEN